MPTIHPSAEPLVPDKIPSQESPLSPEWTHAITTLMGHPLSSEPGKHIKKWIIYLEFHLRKVLYHLNGLMPSPHSWAIHCHQSQENTSRSGSYIIEFINTPCLLSNGIQHSLNLIYTCKCIKKLMDLMPT